MKNIKNLNELGMVLDPGTKFQVEADGSRFDISIAALYDMSLGVILDLIHKGKLYYK